MIFSIVGFSQNSSQSQSGSDFVYNGFTFKPELVNNNNVIFIASINNQEIGYFYFQPRDTESVSVPENFKYDLINTKTVIVVQKPLRLDGTADIGRVYVDRLSSDLQTVASMSIIKAIDSKDLFDERPVYTCDDASEEQIVLVYTGEYSGPSKISEISDYCYALEAEGIEILRLRDRILYLKLNVQ